MSASPFAAVTCVAVLVLQLLGAILPGSSLVFCVAADGHTAVEVAHADGRCLTDYQRHHPHATDTCDFDRHACVDVVLSQQPLCSTAARDATAISQGPALPGARHALVLPSAAALHLNVVATRAVDSRLSAHRTIVLTV